MRTTDGARSAILAGRMWRFQGVAMACALVASVAAAAEEGVPDLRVTPIAGDGQVLVSFVLSEGLTVDIRDAIQSGLATTFSYEVELRRRASAWFDQTIAVVTISATVRFDNLTRRYQMSRTVDGRVEDAQPTDDPGTVAGWMTQVERLPLSRTAGLEASAEYYVRVRAHTRPRTTWFVWPWDGLVLGSAKFTFIP